MKFAPDRNEFELLRSKSRCGRVPVYGELPFPGLDPALLFQELYSGNPNAFLLESGGGPVETSRFTYLGEGGGPPLQIENTPDLFAHNGRPSRASEVLLRQILPRLNFIADRYAHLPHFWGGWVGYLGYEVGALLEQKMPPPRHDALRVPALRFMLVEKLLAYDHKEQTLKIIVSGENAGYDDCLDQIGRIRERIRVVSENLMRKTPTDLKVGSEKVGAEGSRGESMEPCGHSNLSREEYMALVVRAKRYIAEGDIYQANLAQRFSRPYSGDPFRLYLNLRSVNPSPFSGFLKFPDLAIVSSSPERLVKLENGVISTRPIAGTRRRGKSATEDDARSRELVVNEKEKAEHLMLVDLERNDLGRICRYGTVCVTDLMFVEKYSHVIHIVSNIEGRLSPGVGVEDVLRAVFPGGTITGCPKIRCMEIIRELEPAPRGPYSGSFGYIGFAPVMDFNIIIRSIVVSDGIAVFHAGAGIVADSDPEREYQETLDKAAAMFRAFDEF